MPRGPKPTKSKEAKPPGAGRSPKGDGAAVRDLEKRLAEALEQQTATAEILRVISNSPADIKPVLDAVARSAMRLCESYDAMIMLREGEELYFPVHHGPIRPIRQTVQLTRRALSRGWVAGRAVLDRQPVHVHDLAAAGAEFPVGQADAVRSGYRTTLSVPFLREGEAIGAIHLRRREVRPFTDNQIALLQTFAAQAVIAIENVRLFKELEARNRDLAANSEILQVIASSPTDTQPVFDAIARSAAQLCEGLNTYVILFDGETPSPVAYHNVSPEALAVIQRVFPKSATRSSTWGRALLDRAVVHIPDVTTDQEYGFVDVARADDYRSTVAAPMLRDGMPIGAITVARRSPFSEKQIELVKTFADQAVIAIENVRLFKELQARNQDLTQAHAQVSESLERQTATAEILTVISSSPTGVQPTFDAIAKSAALLCRADLSGVHRFDGELIHFAAQYGRTAEEIEAVRQAFPQRPSRASATARCILSAVVVQIADHHDDPDIVDSLRMFRTVLAVPMLREGRPVGSISVARRIVEPFTEDQVELLKTFADQAVIAIENVRLFNETKEALERET